MAGFFIMAEKHPTQIQRDEHDSTNFAKRVHIAASSATIFAVTNTNISLATADIEIGAVEIKNATSDTRATVDTDGLHVSVQNAINSITTIAPRTDYLGLMSVSGNVAVSSMPEVSSLATVTQSGNVNIGDISKGTQTNDVKVTLDSEKVVLTTGDEYIGLATVDIGSSPTLTVDATGSGDVPITLDSEKVVLDASSEFIGLATVTIGAGGSGYETVYQGGSPWQSLVTVQNDIGLDTGANYVGLATVDIGSSPTLTVDATGQGDVPITLDNEKLVLTTGTDYIGLATVDIGSEIVPSTLVHGMVSAASGALVQFGTNSVRWVSVKASEGNATTCYVGGSGATINNGYDLAPGDALGVSIDNTNKLYLVGVDDTEVRYIGGN